MEMHWNLPALFATELSIGVFALMMWIIPRIGRPDILFWVPTSSNFTRSDEASQIVRRYRYRGVVLAGFGLVLGAAIASFAGFWAILIMDLMLTLGYLVILTLARQEALPHIAEPSGLRRASLRAQRMRMPGGLLGQSLPILIVLAAAGWLWMGGDSLPVQIPSDTSEQATHLVVKSPLYFTSIFLFFLGFTSLVALINYGLVHQSRQIYMEGELGQLAARVLSAALIMFSVTNYILAGVGGFVLVMHTIPPAGAKLANWLFGVFFGLGFVVFFGTLLLWVRRRFQLRVAEKTTLQEGGSLPKGPEAIGDNWRCSHIFYYNSEDPALWIQDPSFKRYTLNFARPGSWVFLVLLGISLVALAVCMILGGTY